MSNHTRIVFLCSGNGGNLKAVGAAIESGWLDHASIVTVLTDRKCGANDYAFRKQIENKCIDFSCNDQSELVSLLHSCNPDIIITNVHKIIKPTVVEIFQGKLVNLHYSLLPAFGGSIGQKPVNSALAYGVKLVGVTVHLVDATLDGGKPLAQVAIPVHAHDNPDEVMDIVFRAGCLSLFATIRDFQANTTSKLAQSIIIRDRECLFNPAPNIPSEMNSERFWSQIQTI